MKYSKAWSVVASILKNGLGGDRKDSDWRLWCGASAWQRCGPRVISSKLDSYLLSVNFLENLYAFWVRYDNGIIFKQYRLTISVLSSEQRIRCVCVGILTAAHLTTPDIIESTKTKTKDKIGISLIATGIHVDTCLLRCIQVNRSLPPSPHKTAGLTGMFISYNAFYRQILY